MTAMDTNSNAILDTLRQQLTPSTIQQMSSALGADPQATNNAIAMALPALLGGLASNASRPEGAAALDRALGDHDGSILDNLGSMFGGGGASTGTGAALGGGLGSMIGGKILGHIFGAKRGPVEQGVGKASGLNPAQVAQLLAMLAPIVMGVLGRMKQQKNINPAQLPDVLTQSATQVQRDAPGMDQLSDVFNSAFGSIFKK